MVRRRLHRQGPRPALALVAAMLLALSACTGGGGAGGGPGSGAGGGAGGEETVGTHSLGVPIVTGQWPFDNLERCGDGDREDEDKGPACIVSGEDAQVSLTSLAGVGSSFVSDADVTITYRGGFVTREPTSDPANPERRFVAAFYDVTFPQSQPGQDELRMVEFAPGGADDIGYMLASMGSGPSALSWPNGHRATTGLYQPEPGETLTFAVAGVVRGPTSLIGEHDPILTVRSSYTDILPESDREMGRAEFALLDQDPDAEALADARASIEKVAGSLDGEATGGMEDFEATFAAWLDGEPMTSWNTFDGEAVPGQAQGGDAGATDPSAGGAAPVDGSDWEDPPSPVDDGTGSAPPLHEAPGDGQTEDPWPDGEESWGSGDGGGGPFDGEAGEDVRTAPPESGADGTGRAGSSGGDDFAQPQREEDPLFAAMAMADGLRTSSEPFYDCQMSSLDLPCAMLVEHTGEDGEQQVAIVKLRLGPGSEDRYFDLALRIGTDDPLGAGWVVLEHWYYSAEGSPPDWAD